MHDLAMSLGGDLIPNWMGGLVEADGNTIDNQDLNYRVLTNGYFPFGANLEDLVGLPNVPSTGSLGEASILRSLTQDGRFTSSDISVRAVPLSSTSLGFFAAYSSSTQLKTAVPFLVTAINLGT